MGTQLLKPPTSPSFVRRHHWSELNAIISAKVTDFCIFAETTHSDHCWLNPCPSLVPPCKPCLHPSSPGFAPPAPPVGPPALRRRASRWWAPAAGADGFRLPAVSNHTITCGCGLVGNGGMIWNDPYWLLRSILQQSSPSPLLSTSKMKGNNNIWQHMKTTNRGKIHPLIWKEIKPEKITSQKLLLLPGVACNACQVLFWAPRKAGVTCLKMLYKFEKETLNLHRGKEKHGIVYNIFIYLFLYLCLHMYVFIFHVLMIIYVFIYIYISCKISCMSDTFTIF